MLIEHKLSNISKIGRSNLIGNDTFFNNISTDTRVLSKGDIFLALGGSNYDGHDFINEAFDKGASCVISEKDLTGKTYIKTENSFLFLEKLANFQRSKFRKDIIAITGSNGKTSTKEILFQIVDGLYENKDFVFKSPGNWNNKLGLYLSLLGLKNNHELAIFEIGTNAEGEIKELASFLKPNIGVITNIGISHLEGLKSIDGVFEEKTDLFSFVSSNGTCLIRAKNEYLEKAKEKIKKRKKIFLTIKETQSFDQNFEMAEAVISCLQEKIKKKYHSSRQNIKDLEKKSTVPGRQKLLIGKNKVNLIDDTYNANPDSFRAAFQKIRTMSYKNKICVMGKMNELGDQSQYLEDQVIKDALDIFDQVIALNLDSNIKANNFKIVNSESIFKNLEMFINKDSVILFKASRSVKMEEIVKLFL
ncbi:UDP-N-acetylmuramoyl-tripeptide--D-alanyl-D-alanine ligase [SAR86 cluster bacterium]|nr:UDP-N-acetylmuramoyl-tripeptide--D-alanyl-D-alanine ligase [SAR86 cluster bacterium]